MSTQPSPVRSGQRRRQVVAIAGAVAMSITAAACRPSPFWPGGHPNPPGNSDPKGQLIDLQLLGINDYQVADAQLWATSSNGAQIAFMNAGGVRSDLTFLQSQMPPEGDGVVTYGEAFTFQPFGNTLITYPMTGAQIISVLEEQCQPAGSSHPFLSLGVSEGFTDDLATVISAPPTSNCTSGTVSNVKLNGVALDPVATYNVTVNNFLADGGDNFATFAAITAPRLDGGSDLQALSNYLGTFSPVSPPSIDRVNELS